MRFRQVHLDFHTSEKIKDIGSRFSKKQFQSALQAGHVDSITVFSKCHHGWAYHPSKANQIHPHLTFDLLGAQIEAAHEIGVKTPVYLSAGFDEKTAVTHPEWLYRNIDESTGGLADFSSPGYHLLCLNTPYLDYLLAQIEEVCENYDADGIFLDIVAPRMCYCRHCCNTLIERGLDPYDEKNARALAEEVYANYTRRVREAIDKHKPGLPVFHNGGHIPQGRRDLAYMDSHLELESLPTGGWGYDHFPLSARYVQGLNMEYLGMTGKFHSTWGEFGGFKHPNALRYETALNAANGAKCSVGDQLAPDGHMDMATYHLIGTAYEELEKKESWLDGVTSVADIGVFTYEAYLNSTEASESLVGSDEKTLKSDVGVVRILLEGKYLFDILDAESDFTKYKILILPDNIRIGDSLKQKLTSYLAQGGKLLATGKSGLDAEKNSFAFDFGVKYEKENPFRPDYFRPCTPMKGLEDTGYIFYGKGEKVSLVGGCELAKRENPYFNRTTAHFCSHFHSPNSGEYGGPGMTEGKDGIYIAWQIFSDYAIKGNLAQKQAVLFALDRLLGEQKTLTTSLPAQGIATLMKQKNRLVAHFLYASPVKRGENVEIIEDILPVYHVSAAIRTDSAPKRVYLAPQEQDIPFTFENGTVYFVIEKLENHQMVVLE